MATLYPAGRDEFTEPSAPDTTPLNSAGTGSRNHVEHHRDLGDAVSAIQNNAVTFVHDHSGVRDEHGNISRKLKQVNTHEEVDTDKSDKSIHHTLGAGAFQAAKGNHNHDYNTLNNIPIVVATSTTLPGTARKGLIVYETDTGIYRIRKVNVNGGYWTVLPWGETPICKLFQDKGQVLRFDGSFMEWDRVGFNSFNMFRNNNRTEIIIPETGWYEINAKIAWSLPLGWSYNIMAEIFVNGQRQDGTHARRADNTPRIWQAPQVVEVNGKYFLNKDDRVTIRGRHDDNLSKDRFSFARAENIGSEVTIDFVHP